LTNRRDISCCGKKIDADKSNMLMLLQRTTADVEGMALRAYNTNKETEEKMFNLIEKLIKLLPMHSRQEQNRHNILNRQHSH
jgi:hypothetical protein